MKQLIIVFVIISCLSCKNKHGEVSEKVEKLDQAKNEAKLKKDSSVLVEMFIDSLNIGVKGQYKIELIKIDSLDGLYVKIHLFERKHYSWKKTQSFVFAKDGTLNCDVKLEDFNNDGFNDMTYVSSIRARGANQIRRLFIFDKEKKGLVLMKNSENYPNMLYNKELDCIDAWLVYGGSSTVFLKIDGDSLREFAGVDIGWGEREVYFINKNGERKILRKEKGYEASQVRFSNYKTLEINEAY